MLLGYTITVFLMQLYAAMLNFTNLLVLLYPTVLSYLVTNVTVWYSVTFLLCY